MYQSKSARQSLALLTLSCSSAVNALGASTLHLSNRQQGETMSFLAWIVLGLVAGYIGSKLVNRRGEGIFLDILLGVVGALIGGWLFHLFGASGVNGLNLYSLFVAVIGSVVCLVVYHAVRRV
jgi:uncharacterized membrane protein YeaQ/YmgE (transglycosylase-associated protein family)